MRIPSSIEGTTQKFVKSTFWNQIAKISQFGLGFLFTVVITRKLGKTLYGEYSLLISIAFFLCLFTQFGFENILNTFIPKYRDCPAKVSFLISRLLLFRIIIISLAALIYFGIAFILDAYLYKIALVKSSIYIVAYMAFTSFASLLSRVLVSRYQLRYHGFVSVLCALLQLICAYMLLANGYRLNALLLLVSVTPFALFLCFLIHLRKVIKFPKESFDLKNLLNFGKVSWLTNLVEFGLGKQIDILLIGFLIDATYEAGYYNLAVSIVFIIGALTTAGLSGVALTTFSEIEKKQGRTRLGLAWESMVKLQFILSVPIIAFLAVYAQPIISYIFTETYLPVANMIQVYACFFILQRTIGGGVHVTALYATEKAKTVLITRLVGGFINLALNLILIPKYGAMGAIVATGFCLILTVVLEYICIRRLLRHSYPFIFILKVSLATIVALSALKVFHVETIISLLGLGVGYILILLFIFYLLKPLNQADKTVIKTSNNFFLIKLASFYW